MRVILLIVFVVLLLCPAAPSYSFPVKGQDCTKCHTLTADEVKELLKDLLPPFQVLEVRTTPVHSMWEVDIEAGGQKGILYVDYSKKYLFSGALVNITTRENTTRTRLEEMHKVDVSKVPLGDALLMGSKDAPYKVIAFDDPD